MALSKRAIALSLKSKTVESPGGCWEWQRGKHKAGYGCAPAGCGGGGYAHRAMHEAVIGPIQPDAYVLHSCDNPACVNPEHLFLGTHLDNIRDMHAKNRQRGGSLPNERNPACKLSDEQVRQIRASRSRAGFDISETQYRRILKGESRRGI